MLVTPVRTDRVLGELGTGTVTKTGAEQTLRPIVSHLAFWLPVVLQSGLGGTEGILAFSCYMQQTLLRGRGSRVSPASCVVFKLLRHKKPPREERKKHTEKRKSQVGKNVKKHFEMPVSIFTNRPRHSQGQRTWPGPSGGTVKYFTLHSHRPIYSPDEYN